MKIKRAMGDAVVVALIEDYNKHRKIILSQAEVKQRPVWIGVVVAAGPGDQLESGQRREITVGPGALVAFDPMVGVPFGSSANKLMIVDVSGILLELDGEGEDYGIDLEKALQDVG